MNKYIDKIDREGFLIKEDILSNSNCNKIKNYLLRIADKRIKEGQKVLQDDGSTQIYNFFLEDYRLTNLLSNNFLDNFLTELLGKDYVLRHAIGLNVQKSNTKTDRTGTGWHTDWGYNYKGEKLGYGASYHVIFALDDFNKNNGATHLVPFSHKKKNKPLRYKDYKSKILTMKRGSLAIFDSSIWHKSGPPSDKSRWGLWCVFTQWWVKPYFRFNEMFPKSISKKFSKKIKRLMHMNSTPPLNSKKRILTITTE